MGIILHLFRCITLCCMIIPFNCIHPFVTFKAVMLLLYSWTIWAMWQPGRINFHCFTCNVMDKGYKYQTLNFTFAYGKCHIHGYFDSTKPLVSNCRLPKSRLLVSFYQLHFATCWSFVNKFWYLPVKFHGWSSNTSAVKFSVGKLLIK